MKLLDRILDRKLTREEFLKKSAGVAVGALAASTVLGKATPANAMTVGDNIQSGVVVSALEPASKKALWVDTAHGGIIKFHNGAAWVPVNGKSKGSAKKPVYVNADGVLTESNANIGNVYTPMYMENGELKEGTPAGVHFGDTTPASQKMLWIKSNGTAWYHNGTSWVAQKAVWG